MKTKLISVRCVKCNWFKQAYKSCKNCGQPNTVDVGQTTAFVIAVSIILVGILMGAK